MISGDEYKLCSSSLYNFLHSLVISSVLGPNILLRRRGEKRREEERRGEERRGEERRGEERRGEERREEKRREEKRREEKREEKRKEEKRKEKRRGKTQLLYRATHPSAMIVMMLQTIQNKIIRFICEGKRLNIRYSIKARTLSEETEHESAELYRRSKQHDRPLTAALGN
jgi:hypothetical protein